MIRKVDIKEVYEFHRHLSKYMGPVDTFMISRNVLTNPEFIVLTNDKGIYLIIEATSDNTCKLHAYVDKNQRGKPFLSCVREAEEFVKDSTLFNTVLVYVPKELKGASRLLKYKGAYVMYETDDEVVLRYDLSRMSMTAEMSKFDKMKED